MHFRVGDKVRVIDDRSLVIGLEGVVRYITDTRTIAVEFRDDLIMCGHDCFGHTAEGRGRWFEPNELELVEPIQSELIEEGDEDVVECVNCGEVGHHTATVQGEDVCNYCYDNYTIVCDDCGDVFLKSDIRHFEDENGNSVHLCEDCRYEHRDCEECGCIIMGGVYYDGYGDTICELCFEEAQGAIDDYNYKPDPEFLGDCDNNRYLGVELEIDKGVYRNQFAEDVVDSRIYCKDDGSLTENGVEIVTHPATLDYHMNNMGWDSILQKAKDYEFKSHDTSTCGLHVHVSREAFGETEDDQDLVIGRLLFFFTKFESQIIKFSRRRLSQIDEWASFFRISSKSEDDCKEDAKSLKDGERYYAINLQNYHTVEFRIFRGTLKENTFRATLQFVDLLVDIGLNETIASIDINNFDYFKEQYFNTPELKQYLEERGM